MHARRILRVAEHQCPVPPDLPAQAAPAAPESNRAYGSQAPLADALRGYRAMPGTSDSATIHPFTSAASRSDVQVARREKLHLSPDR